MNNPPKINKVADHNKITWQGFPCMLVLQNGEVCFRILIHEFNIFGHFQTHYPLFPSSSLPIIPFWITKSLLVVTYMVVKKNARYHIKLLKQCLQQI